MNNRQPESTRISTRFAPPDGFAAQTRHGGKPVWTGFPTGVVASAARGAAMWGQG
ncbi:MAG: hypothetical protein Alpg2KO_07100 [Alphaproteobacteria bacterium]